MRMCAECDEEIRVIHAGDESWDYCEACHMIEGNTIDTEDYEDDKHTPASK